MNKYEITWIEEYMLPSLSPIRTEVWTERKARKEFGAAEWEEIKAGYLPHIVAVQVTDPGKHIRRNDD